MTENIERVLERGERMDLLVDKTDRLGVGAHDFRVRSRGLKRQMWWKNVSLIFHGYCSEGYGADILTGEIDGSPGRRRHLFDIPLRGLWVRFAW